VNRAAQLLPLLAVYIAAMLFLPAREGWAGDEPEYLNLAGNITNGFYRERSGDGPLDMCLPGWQTPDLWYGPGFPAFLAPLVGLGLPVGAIRFVGPLLLFAAVLLFHRLLLASVRPGLALGGALAFGLFVPFYRYLPFLHSEFLALVLVLLAMIGTTHLVRSGNRAALVGTSLSLAALALTRVAFGWVVSVLFVIWLALWIARRTASSRRLALAHGLALLVCVPWLVHTFTVTDRPFNWGTSGSLSLYWMSSPFPGEHGDWHCASDVHTQSWLAPHRPFFVAHRGDSPEAQNRALEERALEQIRESPGAYAGNLLANASRIFLNVPYGNRSLDLRAVVFLVPGAALLASLALALPLLARRRGSLPAETTAFALLAAVSLAIHLPLAAYVRMLIPILPPLLWLVVVGLGPALRGRDANDAPTVEATPSLQS
jgi:hypothetical protein